MPIGRLRELTIGETFFGHGDELRILEETILPALIEARRDVRTLRIWSAACATGEEPYSIAIALQRLVPDWDVTILATDTDPRFLDTARAGSYPDGSFRDVPPSPEWFTRSADRWQLNDVIRSKVRFERLDLVEDPYPASMDVIVCRNVLMYFDEATRKRVTERMTLSLAADGCFLAGHDRPLHRSQPNDDAGAFCSAALTHLEQGDLSASAESFHQSLSISPTQPAVHYLAGVVALARGQKDEARRHYRAARHQLDGLEDFDLLPGCDVRVIRLKQILDRELQEEPALAGAPA